MLLFLDVDGALLPFGAAAPYPAHEPAFPLPADADHPLLSRVDPALGARLLSLGCDLVWATTWTDDANTCLAPWLGLPRLPLVEWPESDDGTPTGLHWKTLPVVAWAAGRDFVWLDDEISEADRVWVAAHHPGRALLYRLDHRVGVTEEDFGALEAWIGK